MPDFLFDPLTRRVVAVRALAGAACLLLITACGNDGSATQGSLVSCRAPDTDRPTCIEDEPYNDDMRLVAASKCREVGGSVGTSCPTKDLVGTCETVNAASFENRKPWEFSRRRRTYYYAVPGAAAVPPDASELKKQCEQHGRGQSAGRWADGNTAS